MRLTNWRVVAKTTPFFLPGTMVPNDLGIPITIVSDWMTIDQANLLIRVWQSEVIGEWSMRLQSEDDEGPDSSLEPLRSLEA